MRPAAMIVAGVILLFNLSASGQDTCQSEWDSASKNAQAQSAKIQTAGEGMRNNVEKHKSEYDACMEGTIRWEKQHWAFDVPEVKMVDQRISFDVPETTMTDRRFSWDNPTTVCDTRCDGPTIPVIVCKGFSCKTENRPSCYPSCRVENRRQEIVVGVPEIRMSRREIVMGIPQVGAKRVDWYFDGPSFYPTSGCLGRDTCAQKCGGQLEDENKREQSRFQAESASAQRAMVQAYAPAYKCSINSLTTQRQLALTQIDGAITAIKAVLASDAARDASIASEYSKRLTELEAKRAETNATFEKAIQQLQLQMATTGVSS